MKSFSQFLNESAIDDKGDIIAKKGEAKKTEKLINNSKSDKKLKNAKPGQTTGTQKPKRGATAFRQTGQRNLFTGKVEPPKEVKVKTTYNKKNTTPKTNTNQTNLFTSEKPSRSYFRGRKAQRKPNASGVKPTGSIARGTYKSSPAGQRAYDYEKMKMDTRDQLKREKDFDKRITKGLNKRGTNLPKGVTPSSIVKQDAKKFLFKAKSGDRKAYLDLMDVVDKDFKKMTPAKQSEMAKRVTKIQKAKGRVFDPKTLTFKDPLGFEQQGKRSRRQFPGDKSGAYQAAKSDLEARKGFKGAKTQTGAGKTKIISGLKADEKNPFVKTSVRKGRADTLGGNIFDAPKVTDKDFKKGLKDIKKSGKKFIGPRETQAQVDKRLGKIKDPFKGATGKASKGALKDFEFQPRDRSARTYAKKVDTELKKGLKTFRQFSQNLQDYKDRDKPTMRTGAVKSPSKPDLNISRYDVGMADDTPKPKNKSGNKSGYSKSNAPKPGSEVVKYQSPKPTKPTPVSPTEVVRGTFVPDSGGQIVKRGADKVTDNFTEPPKGKELKPAKVKTSYSGGPTNYPKRGQVSKALGIPDRFRSSWKTRAKAQQFGAASGVYGAVKKYKQERAKGKSKVSSGVAAGLKGAARFAGTYGGAMLAKKFGGKKVAAGITGLIGGSIADRGYDVTSNTFNRVKNIISPNKKSNKPPKVPPKPPIQKYKQDQKPRYDLSGIVKSSKN